MKIEVGKKYELNNGDIHECTFMDGDNPLSVDECGEFYSDDPARDAADAILDAITPPPLEWYINYDHWEATTPHGTYEVGDGGTNSAWVKFPDGSNMWVKPFEMGKRLCDMDNAVSVLGVKEGE